MSRINVANFRHPDGTDDNINLDSSGRVLIGTSSASGDFGAVVNAGGTARVFLARGSLPSNAGGLGNLGWGRTNGEVGATIGGIADADWTSGSSYPTRLSFRTTASGASSTTEQMRLTSTGDLRFNSGYGSVTTVYGCRAWCYGDLVGTIAIHESGGVTSLTDSANGQFIVNFSFTFPDVNYAVTGTATDGTGEANFLSVRTSGTNPVRSTTAISMEVYTYAGGRIDAEFGLAVFR